MLETRSHAQPKHRDAAVDDGDNAATTKMELDVLHADGSGEEDVDEMSTSRCSLEKVCVPRCIYFSKLQCWRNIMDTIKAECGMNSGR